ncbi:DJ-1/PfpI family protein [Shigella flexneri]
MTCSRGVKLLADAPLVEVADGEYDVIVLPGGIKGRGASRDSTCWLKPLNSPTVPAYRRGYFRRRQPPCCAGRYLPIWRYDRLADAERQNSR